MADPIGNTECVAFVVGSSTGFEFDILWVQYSLTQLISQLSRQAILARDIYKLNEKHLSRNSCRMILLIRV